jgi:hypothetical protein
MSRTPKSVRPTFPLSVVNFLGNPLRKQLLPIDTERAMKLAERLNGLDDYGEDAAGFRARLDETVESLLRVDWNTVGRFGVRYILNWQISNRLRVVELLKQRPEIEHIEIERPLVITGLFRTGTTYLHNVMAGDPNSRVGRLWELSHPVGRRSDLLHDEKWRRRRAGHEVSMDDLMVPEQDVVHKVTVDAYEEDFFLLENDMAVMKLFIGFGDFAYAWRMLDWDMVGPYRWHRRQLQILSEQRSGPRWLLKCPWHLWNLKALLTVYPDAQVIQTHRGLVDAIGSQCSLTSRIAGKFQQSLDLHDVGRFWLEYSRAGIDLGREARRGRPASQFYDVRLDGLRARPLEVIEDIYRQFGLPFDEGLAEALSARIALEPTAQFGEHDYDIADYGPSAAEIQSAFEEYRREHLR